jgi:hypothetical protein
MHLQEPVTQVFVIDYEYEWTPQGCAKHHIWEDAVVVADSQEDAVRYLQERKPGRIITIRNVRSQDLAHGVIATFKKDW